MLRPSRSTAVVKRRHVSVEALRSVFFWKPNASSVRGVLYNLLGVANVVLLVTIYFNQTRVASEGPNPHDHQNGQTFPSKNLKQSGVKGLLGSSDSSLSYSCRCDDSFTLKYSGGGLAPGRQVVTPEEENSIKLLSEKLGVAMSVDPEGYESWAGPGPLEMYNGTLPLVHDGFDPVCSARDQFLGKSAWFREDYKSQKCNTMPRERALAFVMANLLQGWSNASKVHESSPNDVGISKVISDILGSKYLGSQYDPSTECQHEIPSPKARKDVAVDLERQCFDNAVFDLVLTQDVFEHIYDTDSSFREIARTLKPGGFHIFTVPLTAKHHQTFNAATRNTEGNVILHAPPSIHGNPMMETGSLMARQWGYDICDSIEASSGMETMIVYVDGPGLGIQDVEYRDIVISRKAGVNPMFPHLWDAFDAIGSCPKRMYMCDIFE